MSTRWLCAYVRALYQPSPGQPGPAQSGPAAPPVSSVSSISTVIRAMIDVSSKPR